MRVGFFYTVFDGFELLPGSMSQLENFADEIVIVWQDVSNTGNKCDEVQSFVEKLTSINIHTVQYFPDLRLNAKENERLKHNLALRFLKKLQCTHFIAGACDHYYRPEDLQRIKKVAPLYDVTLTSMFTYYKYPEWQLTPIEDYYMPFMHKLYPETEFVNTPYVKYLTDPSVRVNTRSTMILFHRDDIMLHHYSMVRIDIEKKLRNSASFHRWKESQVKQMIFEYNNYDIKENPGVGYFSGRRIKEVPNYFPELL